jgi:ribosomal protein L16/L10AE
MHSAAPWAMDCAFFVFSETSDEFFNLTENAICAARELSRRTLSMTEAAEVNVRNHPAVALSNELSQRLRSILDHRRT